jgi:hypothetical protein
VVGCGISPSRTPQIYQQCVGVIQQAIRVSARKPERSVASSVIEMMSEAPSFKEVIQPQVPLRLPCYDFTPVMNHTVVTVLPKVRLATSGATHSHGVTGGVYKARERIHRDILIRDY